jgi:hypothetical protein
VEPVSSSSAALAAARESSATWSEAHVKASAAEAVARESSSAPAPSAKNSSCPL